MNLLERPKSLTELVTETLREWIVSGKLDLGEHLSEVRVAPI
jgi:DNA-binding GntR family transcriptional regulator